MAFIIGVITALVGLWMLYTGFILSPVWLQWLMGSSIVFSISGFFFALAKS